MGAITPVVSRSTKPIPIGLELWTVRTDLKNDFARTLEAVAKLGYQSVEFFSTYLDWTIEAAADVRRQLNELGLTCSSTHNGMRAFTPEAIARTVELNGILGSRLAVVASIPKVNDLDEWRTASDRFAAVADALRPQGLVAGFHNHQQEWVVVDGVRPMDLIASRTPADFVLQFDVGPAVEAGADPVAWMHANAGRIRSVHCRDWSRTAGYRIPFGEGDCPWVDIFAAAESVGGVETYLIEHGHTAPEEEFPMAKRGLENWKALRNSALRTNPGPRTPDPGLS